MKIVRTTCRNYLCTEATQEEDSIHLKGSMPFEGTPEARVLAHAYLLASLSGTLLEQILSVHTLESIDSDAGDVGPMVEALLAFAPQAQRRVLARATAKEVFEAFASQ